MKKLAIYTAIFGGYEGLIPQKKNKNIEYFCFTDRPLKANNWNVIQVEPPLENPARSSRVYKILPHRFLKDYERSIWIDGNMIVRGDVVKLATEKLQEKSFWAFDHSQAKDDPRNCIYEELEAIKRLYYEKGVLKDNFDVMDKQINRYREEGYPEKNGLICGTVLMRNHHDPEVIKTMECWWDEYSNGSKRDQLSFNYAAWKTGLDYGFLSGDVRSNEWFFLLGMHRADYSKKLFRYRLKRLIGLV